MIGNNLTKNLLSNARRLRKNMTPEERRLWYDFLKNYPIHIYKQKPIYQFIVDFYCDKAKLAIELDGSQHYDGAAKEADEIRAEAINALGIEIIRFSNFDISNNFEGVCKAIDKAIKERVEHLSVTSR